MYKTNRIYSQTPVSRVCHTVTIVVEDELGQSYSGFFSLKFWGTTSLGWGFGAVSILFGVFRIFWELLGLSVFFYLLLSDYRASLSKPRGSGPSWAPPGLPNFWGTGDVIGGPSLVYDVMGWTSGGVYKSGVVAGF